MIYKKNMKFFKKKDEIVKAEYNETPFNIIQNSNVLTQEDLDILAPLTKELSDNFSKVQMFRTRTEMEVSVLNDIKFPTSASKYWQAVREQNVMFQELVLLSFKYRKNLVEIKKIERKIRNTADELEREELMIDLEEKKFISKNQEKTASARIEELKNWSDIKKREASLMNKAELKNVDNHQLISYVKRWINQSVAMGQGGSPAERQNLLGQLSSGIKLAIKRGVISEVLKGFSEEISYKIKKDYGLC